MTNQELTTCALNNIPIKVAIINNGALGMVRQWQTLFYNQRYSNTVLHSGPQDVNPDAKGTRVPDFVKLSEAMGCVGLRCERPEDLDKVIDAINATGYGLTLGVHSRIDETIDRIAARVKVGNVYVNRNQIGAVVGVQPFGGQGLSGTGPKAGGPHYLLRFATEKVVTVNTTAAGGNASLLTLGD
jgi:glyoxylate carboligase